MRNKLLILSAICVAFLLFRCTKQPVSPDTTPAGLKKVSLSSSERFQGDLSLMPQFQNFYAAVRRMPDTSKSPVAAKTQLAPLQFKEAKVIVLNYYNEEKYFNTFGTDTSRFYCGLAQANHKAFYGRRLDNYDDMVAGFREYGFLDVVHTGTMQKVNGFVEGDVLVKPGLNSVIVCFINDSGKVFWTSYCDYLYLSDTWNALFPGTGSEMKDGWQANPYYMYDTQMYDSLWQASSYQRLLQQSFGACYYPPVNLFYLPALWSSGYLGFSQEYADYKCGACVDTSHVATATWKSAGAAGFSQGIASLITLRFPASGGNPFVAYRDAGPGNLGIVRQYNGTSWVLAGGAAVAGGDVVTALAMTMRADTPYVAYSDSTLGNRITAKRLNGTVWDTVGTTSFSPGNAGELAMTLDRTSGTPYVAFADTGSAGALTVMSCIGAVWRVVGNQGFSPGPAAGPALTDNGNGVLYAGFRDGKNGNRLTVMKFNTLGDITWSQVGPVAFSTGTANYITLAFGASVDTPYVCYDDGAVRVQKFDGTSWVQVGTASLSYYPSGGASMKMSCGTVRVAFSDGFNAYHAAAEDLLPTGVWSSIGITNSISSSSIGYPSIDMSPIACVPYVAFQDGFNGNKLTVMFYGP